jgi:hypothetical protein
MNDESVHESTIVARNFKKLEHYFELLKLFIRRQLLKLFIVF